MKTSLLTIGLFLLFSLDSFCQYDYQRYMNQFINKVNEMEKEFQRSSQFAMRSTNKDIYVLYVNGNKFACFSDEWGCKAQINSIKLRLESMMEDVIKACPSEYRSQLRNATKGAINQMKFSYRREANPNYRTSGLSDRDNGLKKEDFQGLNDFFQNMNEDNFGTIQTNTDVGEILSAREQNKLSVNGREQNSAPEINLDGLDKYLSEDKQYHGNAIPIEGIKVNTQNSLSDGGIHENIFTLEEKYMRMQRETRNSETQMQNAIDEIKKIERYCRTYPADCERDSYYAEKKKEAEQKLEEAKIKLTELRKEEYQNEKVKQEQELKKYEEYLKNCVPRECAMFERGVEETKAKLNDINKKIDNAQNEITRKENSMEEKASQISWADQKEEISKERLIRLEEQERNIAQDYKDGKILFAEYNDKMLNIASQKAGAITDIGVAKTVNTATSAYNYSKEIVGDFVQENKDVIINTGEFIATTGVSLAGAAIIAGTEGVSTPAVIGVVYTTNTGISTYCNQLRGLETGAALKSATKSTAVDTGLGFIPIKGGKLISNLGDVKGGIDAAKIGFEWSTVNKK